MKFDHSTIREIVTAVQQGAVSCVDIINHFSHRINKTESNIQAWQHYDASVNQQQATVLDKQQPHGALHGIPVGLKDIFDTTDYPTEYGSQIYTGHQPATDSTVARKLKEAGAVVMGKTVTTEFAFFNPAKTRHPHNFNYSPGGSSSGSAAAVAAGHIPVAIGSQTNGSVIRPASFCGVYGFKPSRGLVSRYGVLETSSSFDHVGVFANHLEDIATVTDAIATYDPQDNASYQTPDETLYSGYQKALDIQSGEQSPSIAWLEMPYRDRYSADANAAFESFLTSIEGTVSRIEAPAFFSDYLQAHKVIYDYEIVRALEKEINQHWDLISETAQPIFTVAQQRTEAAYLEALSMRESAIQWFDDFFKQHDAILTPSALSEAPLMGSTGDPVCCTTWTLCGLPCINLPLLKGSNQLPIGLQLVGAARQDHLLMYHAHQFLRQI